MSVRPARTLAAALAQGPVVLDGGLSNQLESQGCDLSDELWSARLLADDPRQIQEAHTAYARAGAQVLTTASYQATFEGFARRGLSHQEAELLLARSVQLARTAGALCPAADPAGEDPHGVGGGAGGGVGRGRGEGEAPQNPAPPPTPWVAASVGPYGAFLADGSEYRGRYGLSVRELERFHRPRIEALVAAGPDVLALETVPDVDEAEALLRAVEGCGVPVWLSYSIAGGRTRAGQDLAAAFALAAGWDQVIAVGVNCCDPADADRAVPLAASVTGKPVVVYPNSGERWDAVGRRWTGGARFEAARVAEWTAAGARLVGGCCRVGPAEIARLAARVGEGPG
ncbi:homocysteine S-methyltransferase [Streptomyces sp. ASQP_92]|nr:homocysteine S-methyltransferase [Streptomyces sp. ASQP_92]MCT9090694.1 homocysteine S-methyltransferase [Streptomyces sp. ASQP_92]